jgi:hypothetical protein
MASIDPPQLASPGGGVPLAPVLPTWIWCVVLALVGLLAFVSPYVALQIQLLPAEGPPRSLSFVPAPESPAPVPALPPPPLGYTWRLLRHGDVEDPYRRTFHINWWRKPRGACLERFGYPIEPAVVAWARAATPVAEPFVWAEAWRVGPIPMPFERQLCFMDGSRLR